VKLGRRCPGATVRKRDFGHRSQPSRGVAQGITRFLDRRERRSAAGRMVEDGGDVPEPSSSPCLGGGLLPHALKARTLFMPP